MIKKSLTIKYFLIILVYFLGFQKVNAQQSGISKIDSLQKALDQYTLSNSIKDTLKVDLLNELTYEYHKTDPEKGVITGESSLALSKKLNWKKGIGIANNFLGLCYWAKADYPKALTCHFEALKICEEINYQTGIANILGNIGLVYEAQHEYSKALNYHFKALDLNRKLANKSGEARNLGNIGIVYDAEGNYTSSLDYYFKALKLYEELNDRNGIARNLGNIGFTYQEQSIHHKSLEYHLKALNINKDLGNKILMGMNLGNIGAEYLSIAKDTSTERLKLLPDSLRNKQVLRKGVDYLNQSIAIFKEINDLNSLQELYRYLSEMQELSGNYKESLNSYRNYVSFKDSVYSDENEKKISVLEKSREEDLKQKEIELLKSQNEIERLTAQRRKGINYGLGGAFIGLCFLTFAFFKQSKNRERINNQLQSAYSELKDTQEELIKQEKLASLGKLTSAIAHEIQNPLNFVNNFSDISTELSEEILTAKTDQERYETVAELKVSLQKISHHGKRADQIIKKMFQHLKDGKGFESFDDD